MDQLFGLPAHPLVVHAPVVLIPLAVIGALAMMTRPRWYHRFRWPVLAIAAVGTLGAIISAGSGEELEEAVEGSASSAARHAIHEHAEAGELARTLSIVFLVALAVWVLVPWWSERRNRSATHASVGAAVAQPATGSRWLRTVLMVGVGATAVASLVTIVEAGHSGASSVWDDVQLQHDGG